MTITSSHHVMNRPRTDQAGTKTLPPESRSLMPAPCNTTVDGIAQPVDVFGIDPVEPEKFKTNET